MKCKAHEGSDIYTAHPITEAPLIDDISTAAIVAWFRRNSCYSCKFREEAIDQDPERDYHWCSRTHKTSNIIDMVDFFGYSNEGQTADAAITRGK